MINLPKIEEKILRFWQKNKIFQKSLAKKSPEGDFVFYEGPPTANGRPHVGHVLARAYKDIVCRYKTMRRYHVERKAGWDTHGLPVELEVEKEIGISGKPDIEKYGVEKFNKRCKESAWKYKDEWEKITKRIGYWLDLENPYVTYDKEYIETLWWIIERIWQKGLLYQDYKVVPYCPRCSTTLSSHEVAQGYKNIEEDSVYIKFKLKDSPSYKLQAPSYFLIWTTTPWTLLANVALAINKNVRYVKILKNDENWILAKACLGRIERPYQIVDEFLGEDLLGIPYEPLYQFVQPEKKAWYVIHGDFVSIEDGTGIVHIAPAFGEEDMDIAKENDLPVLLTVDRAGKFIPEVKSWAGICVKDADPLIIEDLKARKILVKVEKIKHDYPFCWRCETPLLYYAKLSWFIKVSDPKVKGRLLKNNSHINWVPAYIKEGRFGEWLENIRDWAISRERYWGTPLPMWECAECGYRECVGSFEELARRTGKKLSKDFDPHRPYIDELSWICPRCRGKMHRVAEVIDVWFDSGAMPFAQYHWPFAQAQNLKSNIQNLIKSIPYPADFIAEGIDQTRGWFYSLLAISTLLEQGTSYKNIICLGLILDSKGQKMSKSKGNVVWPEEVLEKFGADPLRWYFYTINQPGDTRLFDLIEVKKVIPRFFLILWNVFQFWKMHSSKSDLSPLELRPLSSRSDLPKNILDRWILAKLNLLIKDVTSRMEKYDITRAARQIEGFVNDISLWYVRRSRERFKAKDKDAPQVLGHILVTLSKLLAPFTPFISEELYQNLNYGAQGAIESVHLENWPEMNEKMINDKLLNEMQLVRQICELGRAARAEAGIKVRQPLSELQIINNKLSTTARDTFDIVKDELNVKEIEVVKKLPEGKEWQIKKINEDLAVALNTEITPELKEEGIAREIVRQINSLRKNKGLTIKDKIKVGYQTDSVEIKKAVKKHQDRIRTKTISTDILEKELVEGKEIQIDGEKIKLGFEQ